MSKLSFATCLLLLLGCSVTEPLLAQQQTTVTHERRGLLSITSRDYWFALPQNYEDQAGKYVTIYLSSTDSTTAHIEMGGTQSTMQLVPGRVEGFNVPLSWEIKTSSIVENKAIHVWSDDASLFVDMNSHNPYTSDATYILPQLGWGTTYVVASYASLNVPGSNWDYPSEFVIIADQDGTDVDVTPTADIRYGSTTHPAHVTFTEHLNRGQCVQYKVVNTKDSLDLTGTVVRSTRPVGVIGASQCPDIPVGYPYCDFICEMLQPVRAWGMNYYTAPSLNRTAGDTYLMIGTRPHQNIYHQTSGGTQLITQLQNSFDTYFEEGVTTAGKWYSDQPFLLVQYLNSSTYDCSSCGFGDPAEIAVNSAEQLSTPVIFNIPSGTGGTDGQPYEPYMSIVARAGEPVTLDGHPLNQPAVYNDGDYSVYSFKSTAGAHTVASDSGVGVTVYAYGSYESIGYAGALGVSSLNSLDSVSPLVVTETIDPTTTRIQAQDNAPLSEGLSHFQLDTLRNLRVQQPGDFIEGNGTPKGYIDVIVKDPSKPAYGVIGVYDLAGNRSVVRLRYAPGQGSPMVRLDDADIGSVKVGQSLTMALHLSNVSQAAATIDSITSDNRDFALDLSSFHFPQAIYPGEDKLLQVSFTPTHVGQQDAHIHVYGTGIATSNTVHAFGAASSDVANDRTVLGLWLQNGSGELAILPPTPNPAPASTTLTYAVRHAGNVTLELFSVLGGKVFNLANGHRQSGVYDFTLDTRALAPGTYIYRISDGSEVRSGRLSVAH